MKTAQFVLMAAVVLLSAGNPLEAQDTLYTAYVVAPGTIGDQNLVSVPQKLGMDFNVNQPIWIVSLGVFDSGGDGLRNSTAAHIFNRDTGALLTTLSFSKAEPGDLIGGSRFKTLPTALALAPGFHGSIVADYFPGPVELNGNKGNNRPNAPWSTDSGGGALTFVGTGRIGYTTDPALYPIVLDSGPADRYAAGTFQFSLVPEPSTLALVGIGLGSLLCFRRRK